MRKRILSLLLAALMLVSLLPLGVVAAGNFSDVPAGEWYSDAVAYVDRAGLMGSMGGAKFEPHTPTNRAMIWTILARLSDVNVDGGDPWYAKAQSWAVKTGVSDGTAPLRAVTREELVTMLYRFAGSPAVSLNQHAALSAYTGNASAWAEDAMAWAVSSGIIDGIDGDLAAQGSALRSQLAVMLMRYEQMDEPQPEEPKEEEKEDEKPAKPVIPPYYPPYIPDNWGHEHEYEAEVTQAATCTTNGVMTYTCECEDTYTEVINATGHSYTSTTTDATCTEAGKVTYTCSKCGHSYSSNTALAEHEWNDGVVTTEATCTTEGVKTFTCTVCQTQKTEGVEKTEHDWVTDVSVGAQDVCTAGTYQKCNNTGCSATRCVTEATSGHVMSEWTKTETEHSRQCTNTVGNTDTVCSYMEKDFHTFGDWAVTGSSGKRTCEVCAYEESKTFYAKIGTAYYETLNAAIEAASNNAKITLLDNIIVTSQITLDKTVQILGANHSITAGSEWVGTENDVKHLLNVTAGVVTVKNLTLNSASKACGVQAWGSNATLALVDATITNSLGAGLTVNNGARVSADNLSTSGNAWGAVNVDGTNSKFTLRGNGTLGETNQIWSELESLNAVDATGYYPYQIVETMYHWSDKPVNKAVNTQGVTSLTMLTSQTVNDNLEVPNNVTLKLAEGVSLTVTGDVSGKIVDSTEAELIFSETQLRAFANAVNGGNTYAGKIVKLMADIDLKNVAWTPIGQTGATQFLGTFDGDGKTISNLMIDSSDKTDEELDKNYSSGLFGWAEGGATIKNVKVDGATVLGHHNVAVIAGYISNTTKIQDCEVKNASLTNTHSGSECCGDKTGVIVGNIQGSGCSVTGCVALDCTVAGGRDAGQLVGANTVGATVTGTATNVTVTYSGNCTHTNAGGNIRNELVGRTS